VGGEEGGEEVGAGGVGENEGVGGVGVVEGGVTRNKGMLAGGEVVIEGGDDDGETRERAGEGDGDAAGGARRAAKRPRASDAAADRPVSAIGMSKSDKAVVGRMVKTLLDTGRLQWLSDRGLAGRLVGYVAPAVSPENRLIVVARSA